MFELFAASLMMSSFATYPSLGDKIPIEPRAVQQTAQVEATIDKGLIVEMIVRCPVGTGIITYSKIERLYCSPQHVCGPSFEATIARTCR